MNDVGGTPAEAIMLMKMALGLIDASGGGATPVARHLNAAVEIAMQGPGSGAVIPVNIEALLPRSTNGLTGASSDQPADLLTSVDLE